MDSFDFIHDPLTAGQVETLARLLGDQWTAKARDGFLVISGRFIDESGTDRTDELELLFNTDRAPGRRALKRSLEALLDFVGGLDRFEEEWFVTINDPIWGNLPLFPQLPILGIEEIVPQLYRVFDSRQPFYGTTEPPTDYIMRTGRLAYRAAPHSLVLRTKPRMYWCSYSRYGSPQLSQEALQILDKWRSDCKLRATLPTRGLDGSVFVAFSGVMEYAERLINLSRDSAFAGYNVEMKVTDHPELPGGGLQVGVVGEPKVSLLEEWSEVENRWKAIWEA